MMRRRDMLALTAGASILAAPNIVMAQRERTLKFVPTPDLVALDPVWGAFRTTHVHAHMIFDTLYGLDETFTVQPQMVEGQLVENEGKTWKLRLRDGLRFHDGEPVIARDCVASIRRWMVRDGFGQSLQAAISELSAPDDRTILFILSKPFPQLPVALAGSTITVPCIMPERLARTDPFTQVNEMIGSGPYRFLPDQFNAGVRAAYERFSGYVPRSVGTQSYTAGPKVTHFDRVEWMSMGDPATAVAALLQGEIDWLDSPSADQIPLLARNSGVVSEVRDHSGSVAIMRFNQLQPPFDNPAIRRALLGAVDQSDVMNAVAGTDRAFWRDRIGLFGPASPLANEAGIEVLSKPRDYDQVKRDLAAAGYRGEKIVVLAVGGNSYLVYVSQVGADQLRKAGMNVDVQTMDASSMFRRTLSKETPDKGGWNVYFTLLDGLFNSNPATNTALRGDGKSGQAGWPRSPDLEVLREQWLDASDTSARKRLGEQMQSQLWRDVPYIPMGHWVRSTAHRREIVDLPWGFAAFYGVRRV